MVGHLTSYNRPVPFTGLDTAGVARALSQVADRPGDLADAFFERTEEVELVPDGGGPGLRLRREEGFALRLVRDGRTWLAARDQVQPRAFAEALRQVARALPAAAYPEPVLAPDQPGPPRALELLEFPAAVERAVRAEHVAFPLRLALRRHRRWVQVVGPRLVPAPEVETFYSVTLETPWGRHGALLPALGPAAASAVAASAVAIFRAREAAPAAAGRVPAVLGPNAAAVLLHEVVAHALECDTLALGGAVEAAVGVQLGAAGLDVLDDPAAAPAGVRRTTDDEGLPVCRRWLLRNGVVEQPLADALAARASPALIPGAGRRSSRHLPPVPRSHHLELLPGELEEAELLGGAEGGLLVPEVSRGSLDPLSGEFRLEIPHARRIRRGAAAEPLGRTVLRGRVADLLARITGVGRTPVAAGAGWCAKGGQKLPVWATTPALRVDRVEIVA
jgi:predicted Zn-dependent protease